MAEYEKSQFLKDLVKWINTQHVSGKPLISRAEFYTSTFGNANWEKGDGGADIGADIAYNAPPEHKATVGGLQISNFLNRSALVEDGLAYFKDSLFLDYMLAMYSNIKILDNGTSVEQGPEPIEDIKIPRINKKQSAFLYARNLLQHYQVYFTTTIAYDKSNAFLAKRINPYLMVKPTELQFRKKGLVELFHDHLVAREPLDWTEKERRLFLLMSGQHYAKNDLGYLNLMDTPAANPGPVFENFYGTKVLKFWHDNFNAAATIEGAQETPELKALEGYIGQIDLQTFANHITHGSDNDDLKTKIVPYTKFLSAPTLLPPLVGKIQIDKLLTMCLPSYGFRDKSYAERTKFGPEDKVSIPIENNSEYQKNFPKATTTDVVSLNMKYLIGEDRIEQLKNAKLTFIPKTALGSKSEIKSALTAIGFDSSTDTWVKSKLVAADVGQKWQTGRFVGPPAGPLFKIPKDKNLLQYSDKGVRDKLASELGQALANELGGGVQVTSDEDYPTSGNDAMWKPIQMVSKVIQKEFQAFQKRYEKYRTTVQTTQFYTLSSLNLTLEPYDDDNPTTAFVVQLWIDAVNVAARKAYEWLMVSQANSESMLRWLVVRYYAKQNKTNDQIAELLKDKGLDKDKPTSQSNTPYKIDLKPPPSAAQKKLTKDELDEKVKQRRKNIDQCLLSTNIEPLKNAYRSLIDLEMRGKGDLKDSIHWLTNSQNLKFTTSEPFGGRFHLLEHGEGQHTSIPNYIGSPPGNEIASFLQMTPDIMSALTPKIRLHRIITDLNGKDVETEFVFNNYVSQDEVISLQNSQNFEKGRGAGIKSFSFSYEGGTPATAKKDIQAELVLFFQSFNELTKERGSIGRKKRYRYIDLLLYPHNDENVKPSETVHPNQFKPSNFRIRADVGWNPRTDDSFKSILSGRGIKLEDFNKSLFKINKTFLLNMIDHDIDFRNDGTVEIKITYAAYIESETRSSNVNALSTPQIEFFRKKQTMEIRKLLETGKCESSEINTLLRLQASNESAYIRAAQGSIGRRMILRKLQRTVFFDEKSVKEYLKDYSSTPPELKNLNLAQSRRRKKGQKEVNFYFLGDLLYTLMDCLYEPGKLGERYNPEYDNTIKYNKRRPELRSFVPLLSSFTYSDYNEKKESSTPIFSANIADIPISVRYFNEWYVEHVVKPERTVYPLMDFIRDLLKAVIDLMTDACINRQIDTSLMFQTAQYTALGKKYKNLYYDPLTVQRQETAKGFGSELIFDVNSEYNKKDSVLPFTSSDTDLNGKINPIGNYFNYTLLYAVSPLMSTGHRGEGIRSKDEKRGTYHFQIGSSRGILKTVNFSKTDMAYLREARFYNQGNYGLLQLGAVYNVTLELFGNTLFYPGMEIFIDPRSFGGPNWDPTAGGANRSVANALGIGGYHIITKVSSNISTSGFTTTVEAVFQYSGDQESRTMALDGQTTNSVAYNIDDPPKSKDGPGDEVDTATPRKSVRCVEVLNSSIQNSIKLNHQAKKNNK